MAKLYPYLSYANAKEALAYYEEVFGATKIMRLPVGEEQAESFGIKKEHLEDTTIHASFTILGADLFCSDNFKGDPISGNQIWLMLDVNSEDEQAAREADAFFKRGQESGTVDVRMPYAEQFWGGKMGQFVDKYGIGWMLHSQPYSKLEG